MTSIRQRLTLSALTVCLLLVCGIGAVTYWLTQRSLVAELDSRLRVTALAIISQARQEKRDLDVEFSDRYLPEFNTGGQAYYQIWRPSGKTEEKSDSLGKALDLPRRPGTLEKPAYWNLALPDGTAGRAIGFDFVPPSRDKFRKHHDPDFNASIVVAGRRDHIEQTLGTLRSVLLTTSGLAALATILVVPFVLRRGLAPLEEVGRRAAAIDAGNLKERFPTDTMPAELRPIGERLNELLARLETSFERERRFSADVAHELRTPIAELQTLAEVSLKWPEGDAAQVKAFEDVHEIAARMQRTVGSLLTIARCEAGRFALQPGRFGVLPLLEEKWKPFAAQARERGLVIRWQVPADLEAESDASVFGQIATNLFSNAARYATRDTQISVECLREPAGLRLTVSNHTAELTTDDLPRLCERFWRKDAARSSEEHAGLGLAVVAALAQTLRGRLEPVLENGVLKMTLRLPG